MKVKTNSSSHIKGYIKDLKIDKRDNYTIYKFNIEAPDGTITTGFSGFNLELKDNQGVEFDWKKNGEFNNVERDTIKTYETLKTVTKKDILSVDKKDEILIEYLKLYTVATHLCMKNNTITDDEIKAQFIRLQKLIGIEKLFSGMEEFIKEKYG